MDKVKSIFHKDKATNQTPISENHGGAGIQPPSSADVLSYRYHHATNIGSIFIQERWLTPSMFPDSAKGSSELAAVESWVKLEGLEKTRGRFERHWRDYVSDQDLVWLRDVARCTTVRLPIGYFTLGPEFCQKTAFRHVAGVYENSWSAVKDLVRRAHERGIGTVIDLHGLPGGANAQDHSGTDSGKTELWGSRANLELATRCVCFVVRVALMMEGVAGIQIVNEAVWDAKGMYEWYDRVLSELSRIDPTMPVYVSDGWNLHRALAWSQGKNAVHTTAAHRCNPVVVDTHLYWCFVDADKRKSPHQIIYEVAGKLSELDGKEGSVLERRAAQIVIGEYSCVLAEESWALRRQDLSKELLVREFGNAQSQTYQRRAGGSFFWTYRMDWMPGGEWGVKQMTEQQAITPPASLMLSVADIRDRVAQAQSQKDHRKGTTFGAHCQYWDTTYPGHYEHWRFEQGFEVGFQDALAFFAMRSQQGHDGGDKIGMMELWCLKRLRESGSGGAACAWEYEHGLKEGIRDFYECVGI